MTTDRIASEKPESDDANQATSSLGFEQALRLLDESSLLAAEKRCKLLKEWHQAAQAGSASPVTAVWKQISNAVSQACEKSDSSQLTEEARDAILRTLVGATCYSVNPSPRVAYLGPMYSYSYLAASKYFSSTGRLSPVATIAAVFDEIESGQSDFGIVPIENSTDGRIVDTLTMFAKKPIRICGEILLPIHHCLLGRCERSEITEVHSKQQPFSQCRNWLSQHLPNAKLVESASTTAAAKLASEKTNVAAIASIEAGLHYGLNVIQANIEDNPHNVTRFAVLGNQTTTPTGFDKTSIMFQIPHRSGALADAMLLLSRHGLNMTWIESFPIAGNSQEYLFFIEFEGHQDDRNVAATLRRLAEQTLRLDVLGSYPRGKAAV
jgi:chorismate mutase/prephenate dehydratase